MNLLMGPAAGLLCLILIPLSCTRVEGSQSETEGTSIDLPKPQTESEVSIEEALQQRQSVRKYSEDPLSLTEIGQLLWAAQGINRPGGFRTAPSAGALYPLEVYVIAGNVKNLPAGIYKYNIPDHQLVKIVDGDQRSALGNAALGQGCIKSAPAVMVLTAVYERTKKKYGERGVRYAQIEVGCAAQNVYLQAVSLSLGTVFIGAFDDDEVRKVLGAPDDEQPLAILPVGKIR
jgi:SagB-type dehydrogenase family enzyme